MADYIKAIREQKAWEEPKKKSGSFGFIAAVIGAFAVGLLLVLSLNGLPLLKTELAPSALLAAGDTNALAAAKDEDAPAETNVRPAAAAVAPANKPEIVIRADGRLGEPDTSPLLLHCYAALTRDHDTGKMKAADVYRLLKVGGKVARIAAAAGAPLNGVEPQTVAYGWGLIADCIFKQNSWAMCEPRNRKLAVESIAEFARQYRAAMEAPMPQQPAKPARGASRRSDTQFNPQYIRQNLVNVHDRTMASFRHLLEEGVIIAADFGRFPPRELAAALSAKPKRNACAGR